MHSGLITTGQSMLRLIQPKFTNLLNSADRFFLKSVSRFHEVTGYNAIEKIKNDLKSLETSLSQQRNIVKTSKENYSISLSNRSNSQREMNELLLRKSAWTPADLERFTLLYKHDHASEQAVNKSKHELDQAEGQLEDMQQKAGDLMGARYREEQLFSDRIRQASTWGTWVLMGINIALFVLVTLVVEPYKRRKLVRAFEERVRDMQQSSEPRSAEVVASSIEESEITSINKETATWHNLLERLSQPLLLIRPIEAIALTLTGYCMSLLGFILILAVPRGTR